MENILKNEELEKSKRDINIRIFGESGSGKTAFYVGVISTFFNSHILNSDYSNKYGLMVPGEDLGNVMAAVQRLYDKYYYSNDIKNTESRDKKQLIFTLSKGKSDYYWPINFVDYKGGIVSDVNNDDQDDTYNNAKQLDDINENANVFYIIVDSIQLANELKKISENKDANICDLWKEEECIKSLRNSLGITKYIINLQYLLKNMKEKNLAIAFLLTKTDSPRFDENGDLKKYVGDSDDFAPLIEAVKNIYKDEIFEINRFDNWNACIFPVSVFGKGNVTKEEKPKPENLDNIIPYGIDRVIFFSMYFSLGGIIKEISQKMKSLEESIKDIQYDNCKNFFSALYIDRKNAGKWKELTSYKNSAKKELEILKTQLEDAKALYDNIDEDFYYKFDDKSIYSVKTTALKPNKVIKRNDIESVSSDSENKYNTIED